MCTLNVRITFFCNSENYQHCIFNCCFLLILIALHVCDLLISCWRIQSTLWNSSIFFILKNLFIFWCKFLFIFSVLSSYLLILSLGFMQSINFLIMIKIWISKISKCCFSSHSYSVPLSLLSLLFQKSLLSSGQSNLFCYMVFILAFLGMRLCYSFKMFFADLIFPEDISVFALTLKLSLPICWIILNYFDYFSFYYPYVC